MTIGCEYREPGEAFAREYGDAHWVRQDFDLAVLK